VPHTGHTPAENTGGGGGIGGFVADAGLVVFPKKNEPKPKKRRHLRNPKTSPRTEIKKKLVVNLYLQ